MKNKPLLITKTRSLYTFFLMVFLIPLTSYAQVSFVWAVGDGEKIFRDELSHPLKQRNHVWDGEAIRLKGLYNEVLAFQLIVETGHDGAQKLEVAVTHPVNKASGKAIGGSSLKYGPSGTVEIFTQHYLNVRQDRHTHPAWFYGSQASAPPQMTGWIPDALIPVDAKTGLGGFPVEVGPTRNQGFWIDVFMPRNRDEYPAGVYLGTVQVYDKGQLKNEIPLEITLLPAFLADQNRTNIWLFTSSVYSYYPELPQEQVDQMLKFEGHRHRIDVVGGFSAHRSRFDPEMLGIYKPWLDGTGFTTANGYWGPGQGVGEKTFIVGMYGANVLGNTQSEVQQQSDLWVNWFSRNAPDVTYFWYITDEPPKERYPWIKERAGWVKSNPGPGKNLQVFTTTGYNEELADAIDFWSSGTGVNLADLKMVRKKGGDYTFYNGYRPRYGSVILEAAAVDFRVNSWILYKYGITHHFIWHGSHWQHNSQGPKGNLHQNVFQNPLSFINFGQYSYGNGDGILFYPGRMPYYPEEDRGLNRLVPSIRLKNIRRGQQDAVLLHMAEEKAGRDRVFSIINEVVPRALDEVERNEPVPWSQHGDDYDRAREKLLGIILN